ncbi:MAG: nucleotidyl transferase AbiEii/AbiGii toxin family protein [Marinilabiliaceae bacterium]|nr:nucleotidyl transferase AbiEii/AbiGii toxin family protein [Marinilabiliaceae bacterium]MBN2819100.1 nucleotidyl transferase AbiEii/AbiGii toxin family protein [Bacteroidales bacterium]
MNRWYNVPDEDKRIAYNQVWQKTDIPAFAVEKDWWVVQTLAILFELEIGKHLVFKGGISLSKSWNIIERFSEDIDLAVDRSYFGFNGDLGKKQRTKLRKTANSFILETLYPELEKAFKNKGLLKVHIEPEEIVSSDQDPIIISVYYPNIIETPGYIQPRIQIEIGCRSLREPFENRQVLSLVDETYPDVSFSQKAVLIPSVLPERTLLEKIFLLHEEFQRPREKIRVDRLSRHLYDIYQMSKSEYAYKALHNKDLYETIVKHRNSFTHLGGVNYNLHQPQTIDFIPPKDLLTAWEDDYKIMQEQMIHGKSPMFSELIESLTFFKSRVNAIEWTMDTNFR